MYLVVGATGPVGLGGEICRQLVAANRPVRALVRSTADPNRVANLARIGVELIDGDLKNPGSLHKACAGIDTVISTASMMVSKQEGDRVENVDGTATESTGLHDSPADLSDGGLAQSDRRF